jgi:hypothetical protein
MADHEQAIPVMMGDRFVYRSKPLGSKKPQVEQKFTSSLTEAEVFFYIWG